jgi:hypothetical protein
MFLLTWFRGGTRWHLSGYFFCTAAIAAVHPGVAVPLILLSGSVVIATLPSWRAIGAAMLAGAAAILLGSTWMLAYAAYPLRASSREIALASDAGSSAAYYFPFLRSGNDARVVTYVALTPFLLACVAIAILMLAVAVWKRRAPASAPGTGAASGYLFAALAALLFTFTHVASRYGLPEVVEVRRNVSWLAMSLAVLLGAASVVFLRVRVMKAAALLLAVLWLWRVPVTTASDRLIHYSGYSATAYAVLEIQRELEPFTWTLVTYGQEFPMVLGKGFHLAAADFLERYDPAQPRLDIPTPYVFIAVEKTAHPFEINTWAARFSRADVERRLQTWCFLYQRTHDDMRVYRDDEDVRVYMIHRNMEAVSP